MKEILRSNNLVLISWIRSVLDSCNIDLFIMDQQMNVLEGSATAIPQRLMVGSEDYERAIKILSDAQSEVDGLQLFKL